MGALHHGHLHLVQQAISHCDICIVSIYVNARQFNNSEDFDKYPRNIPADLKLLEEIGVTAVFTPKSEEELYKTEIDTSLSFNLNGLDKTMEGAHRAGHFEAVARVVERLFAAVRPSDAFFGLKDFQQFQVISHFVAQNKLPIAINGVETVREKEGLAMSSRNLRLSDQEKDAAKGIYAALKNIKTKINAQAASVKTILEEATAELHNISGVSSIDYICIASPSDLQPISEYQDGSLRAFVALQLGSVRLIDNISLKP